NTRLWPVNPKIAGSGNDNAASIDQGAHRDYNGIGFDYFAGDDNSGGSTVALSNRRYAPEEQFGALSGGGAHHRGGELAGMDLCRAVTRTECLVNLHLGRKPSEAVSATPSGEAGKAAISVEAAVAPVPNKLLVQFSM